MVLTGVLTYNHQYETTSNDDDKSLTDCWFERSSECGGLVKLLSQEE